MRQPFGEPARLRVPCRGSVEPRIAVHGQQKALRVVVRLQEPAKGSTRVNTVPSPGWLWTEISPSIWATRLLVMAMPRPVPPAWAALAMLASTPFSVPTFV